MSDPSTQVHTVYHKASDIGTRTGKEMHFDIGIGAYDFSRGGGNKVWNLEGYGKFSFFSYKFADQKVSIDEIGSKSCLEAGAKFFDGIDENKAELKSTLNGATCPDSNDIELAGSV